MPLPKLMVAPNGARRTKNDHPALPVTIAETIDAALSCHAAGADGLHAHVRDADQQHVLDAGLYRELLDELQVQAPKLLVQITTEAVGRYTPAEQRALVRSVRPRLVSVSLVEMTTHIDSELPEVRAFYHEQAEAGTAVQHILYTADEIDALCGHMEAGVIPPGKAQVLFVLGRYAKNQESSPQDLLPFLRKLKSNGLDVDWAVCAFGRAETQCLHAAHDAGGKLRVGFENSFWHTNGTIAHDNAERVAEISALLSANNANNLR